MVICDLNDYCILLLQFSIAVTSASHLSDDECDENELFESFDYGNETIEYDTEPNIEEMSQSGAQSITKHGRKQFVTPRLVAALDNAKVSDGMAVHILIATIESLGHRVEEYTISRSTIYRSRQENRLREFTEISAEFSDNVMQIEIFLLFSVYGFQFCLFFFKFCDL